MSFLHLSRPRFEDVFWYFKFISGLLLDFGQEALALHLLDLLPVDLIVGLVERLLPEDIDLAFVVDLLHRVLEEVDISFFF